MPSGAKKRKAAKKKKVQQINISNNSSNHSNGDDEVKHYDENANGDGELSSPASQDNHNSQHPFTEGKEEELEKGEHGLSIPSTVPEKNSLEGVNNGLNTQNVATEDGKVVQVEWKLRKEEEEEGFKSNDISIESAKEISDVESSGSSRDSSSNSSSSDDESHAVGEKTVVARIGPADSVKHVESTLEVVTQVNGSVTVGETGTDAVETFPVGDYVEVGDTIPVGETDNMIKETEVSVDSAELLDASSEVVDQVSDKILVGDIDDGAVQASPVIEPDKASYLEQVVQVVESASIDKPMVSCVVQLDMQENGDEKMPTSNDSSGDSLVLTYLGSREKETEVVAISEQNATIFLDAKVSAAEEHDNESVSSYNAPNIHTSNNADLVKDSESPECSDKQPLVASIPQTVQKTSWKGCCGLFELFTDSNR